MLSAAPRAKTIDSRWPDALVLEHVSKTFGPGLALDDVSLTVTAGEVHGLLGQNGSGKSTLIKILAGLYSPDHAPNCTIGGTAQTLPLDREARASIAFVHQDLALIPELTVVENLRAEATVTRTRSWISWRAERDEAQRVLDRYDLRIDPRSLVTDLSQTDRALLAISRAAEQLRLRRVVDSSSTSLLVLDEPTVFLPREGIERLFALMREIVADGRSSVLFVSHDLDEVSEITDSVTVLRDGVSAGTYRTAEMTAGSLVQLIVGEEVAMPHTRVLREAGERAIGIRDLRGGVLQGLDLDVGKGEIVGLTGLAGSGFDVAPYLLFGASPGCGTLTLESTTLHIRRQNARRAMAHRIGLVPGDRAKQGSAGELTVLDNFTLPVLNAVSSAAWLRSATLRAVTERMISEYRVKSAHPELPMSSLSGGNQQKVIMAKWLQLDLSLLMLHEPTQGVDVGARAQILTLISALAERGLPILVASSDAEQLAHLCDRVVVFGNGRVRTTIAGDALSKNAIVRAVIDSQTPDTVKATGI